MLKISIKTRVTTLLQLCYNLVTTFQKPKIRNQNAILVAFFWKYARKVVSLHRFHVNCTNMLQTIYFSGVLFAVLCIIRFLIVRQIMRLSDIFVYGTMVLLSWPAIVAICLIYFGTRLANKYLDPVVIDLRRFRKKNHDRIGKQNTVNKSKQAYRCKQSM